MCFFKNNCDIKCEDLKELLKFIYQKINHYLLCGGDIFQHMFEAPESKGFMPNTNPKRGNGAVCFIWFCFFLISSTSGFTEASNT